MKTSSASDFLEEHSGFSPSTDPNSIDGDSGIDTVGAVSDQNQTIEELKNTIKRNLSQISDLKRKLHVTEILLACQIDRVNDKDDVIRVLQDTIELVKKTNEVVLKEMQESEAGVVTCNNDNYLQNRMDSLESNTKDETESMDQENDLDAELLKLECQTKDILKDNEALELSNSELKIKLHKLKSKMTKSQKIKDDLRIQVYVLDYNFRRVSEKLKESSEKLAEYTLNIDSCPDKEAIVPLNNTKNPGIRVIHRDGMHPFMAVFEDIPLAGSGWMVIQRNIDDKIFPFRRFTESRYDDGFGDMNGSFWLGTDIVHQLTTSQLHELYIQVVDLDGVTAYARYDHFEVGSKDEQYKIKSLGSYSGTAGDAFQSLKNTPFVKRSYTDNSFTCWWGSTQIECNLNGQHGSEEEFGFYWGRWSLGKKGCLLKSCKMLIRPSSK